MTSTAPLYNVAPTLHSACKKMKSERLLLIVDELRAKTGEYGWFEFKHNNHDPQRIIKTASAVANGARLLDQPKGYMIWGIEDDTHKVVGTNFDPARERVGNQGLQFWVGRALAPSPMFDFHIVDHPDGRLVVLEVDAASTAPVKAEGVPYIRLQDATPRLSDYPEREAALWAKLRPLLWERGVAAAFVTSDEVLEQIDYSSYFDLTGQRLPDNRKGIFDRLAEERLIEQDVGDRWNILNLGAVLFAKQMSNFDGLSRKVLRVIEYDGTGRVRTKREQAGVKGYAAGFQGIITYINALLPKNEHIGEALRREMPMYPPIAIRELVANSLIHQDFTIRGAGPTVELFSDRVEITNPGIPLVAPDRFIDTPPRSRNEVLASLMRRMNICEERGTGVDKVIDAVELFQLPAPDFRVDGDNVRVVLLAHRQYSEMTPVERVRASFQHAVIRWLNGEKATNSSLRQRFGLPDSAGASSQVSRVFSEAREAGWIKLADPSAPKSGYVPSWA